MEHPVREISHVIHLLVSTPPSVQLKTIDRYFLPTASFTHPLCRTGTFSNSRTLIKYIYRWYKTMSPHIKLHIDSIAFDTTHDILYVSMNQVFSVWAIPFQSSHVKLTTVLQLSKQTDTDGKEKYYIASQEDLYQTDQVVRFVNFLFWFGSFWVQLLQFFATFVCVVCVYPFMPVTWLEEEGYVGDQNGRDAKRGGGKNDKVEFSKNRGAIDAGPNDRKVGQDSKEDEHQEFSSSFVEMPKGSGRYVTAPVSHSVEH